MIFLIALLFLIAIWIVLSIVIWSIKNGIAPMPTSSKAKKALLQALPEDIQGVIYELGAGWGTLLIPVAKRFPDRRVIGFESSPFPYWVARLRLFCEALKNCALKRQDFFDHSLEDAGLVVCYLYPGAMRRLKDKFERELKPGTQVISNTFAIPGWEPIHIVEVGDIYRTKIYVYQQIR